MKIIQTFFIPKCIFGRNFWVRNTSQWFSVQLLPCRLYFFSFTFFRFTCTHCQYV